MKRENGITLISLVIAIIVMIILSSIAIYSATSTLRYAKYNKAKAEIQTIHAQVNKWYEEDIQKVYGEEITETNIKESETYSAIIDTFVKLGINEENLRKKYRFFSSQYLKDEIGLDASFDYIIDFLNRDVILVGGVYYNGISYFTLKDFGINNVDDYNADSISFNLESGENKEIIISDIKLNLKNNTSQNETSTDISKFIVEYMKVDEDNSNWIDVTKDVVKFEDGEENNKKTKYKFSVADFGEYDVRVRTVDKKHEDVKDITLEVRSGIKVGDYITYTSPTASVTLSTAETGDTSEQTLPSKNTFRVMDIDEDGNMTLIGAMISSDQKIYFQGALGYNNAVYTLNKKCSDLYKDTSKGITARSIKVEDITSKFNDTGNGKLTTDISNNLPTSTGEYITNIDTENKTVTYQTRTNYPDIFQYEAGGLIDNTATSGIIGQSDLYSGYNGLTTLANKTPIPTNLTVPYTYYYTTHAIWDFEDSAKSSAYQNMFFSTSTSYWLASRCIGCNSDAAYFGLRFVHDTDLYSYEMYDSGGGTHRNGYRVCPIVYLPSSVKVTVSTDQSRYHQNDSHKVK